ncbi:MAG: type II secretion system GspH family protein [Patescibacteria group bacterium]|nr:type II secretion system GspH family protein [Patescibacteria group bacterium]
MMKSQKGFTLIELLVVIAIVGVLAGAVLVAINPTERINEANDANKKSKLGQVAQAVESCYTNNNASYANCDTIAELEIGQYLKTGVITDNPASLTDLDTNDVVFDPNAASTQYYIITQLAQGSCSGTNHKFTYYDTGTGTTTTTVCQAAAPALP